MTSPVRAWPFWGLVGLGIGSGVTLAILILWNLRSAFLEHALTRQALAEAFGLALVMFVVLLVAGWALSNRPRPPPRRTYDGYVLG